MCVVSMVHDHFGKRFEPYVPDAIPNPGLQTIQWPWPTIDLGELRKLIDEFKEAMAAAKKVDVLTKQPDCVDPEKAKLQERVAELEARLAKIAEAAAP